MSPSFNMLALNNSFPGIMSDVEILKNVKMEPFFCGVGYKAVIDELAVSYGWNDLPSKIQFIEGKKAVSHGLTSYGYDLTLAPRFKVFTNVHEPTAIIDPLNFKTSIFVDQESEYCIIPPNSFALAESVEKITMPEDCMAICMGKSTYARCGIFLGITPIEPGWVGTVTIEISNTTPLPAKVYANMGIAQLIFFNNQCGCAISYSTKKGKYQSQSGITLPRSGIESV